jgi:hypothetical protein
MQSVRSTKAYCTDACRKKAARGGIERQAESKRIVECLRRTGLIARIWPIYSWDKSAPVFALMCTTEAALSELSVYNAAVTAGDFERALRDCRIETSGASERLKSEIRAFYDARRDRRLREGYTPSDKTKVEW